MNDRATPPRFGIFAHVGNGNLGDEATVAALLQDLRQRHPSAELWVFSENPADTERRHRTRALPIRRDVERPRTTGVAWSRPSGAASAEDREYVRRLKAVVKAAAPGLYRFLKGAVRAVSCLASLPTEIAFLARCVRALRRIDRLLIAGGGQIGDYFGGPWGYPFSLFRWCLLARAAGTRVSFVSVGAEPIRSPISRCLLRGALGLADYRSFRDESSRRLIEAIGARGPHLVCPDLVHGLRLPSVTTAPKRGSKLTVGINPVPFFDSRYWTERDDGIYQGYVDALGGLASWLLEQGHRVLFFPTQVHADPPVIRDIELAMKRVGAAPGEGQVLTPLVTDFDDLTAAMGQTDVIVASRFHGIIFSFLLDRPVLGLSYYRKTEDLMEDMGQGDYVLAIRGLEARSLIERFRQLTEKRDAAREAIVHRRREHADALERQYERVLG